MKLPYYYYHHPIYCLVQETLNRGSKELPQEGGHG